MFKEIDVNQNDRKNLVLWDTHDVVVNRDKDSNDGELVIYPCNIGNLRVRFASAPYNCYIYFGKKSPKQKRVLVDIGDESDWGEINIDDPKHPKWGNDDKGYKVITRVETFGGSEIPLDKFVRDVNDQIIYFEA